MTRPRSGRNLTDGYDGFLRDDKYVLLDRDKKFLPLRGVPEDTDTKAVLLPPKSPNLNGYVAHCTSYTFRNDRLMVASFS